MMSRPVQTPLLPYKSVATGLVFSLIFGPVGLLYASFWGGFFMILLGIVIVSCKFIFPILLLWLSCCIWSVASIESYNRKVLRMTVTSSS